MSDTTETHVSLDQPLFKALEKVILGLQQRRVEGWRDYLGDVQGDLSRELGQIQKEMNQREAERDRRVDAMQKLVDDTLAAHNLAERFHASLTKVAELEAARDKALQEAERLRAIVRSSWAGKLWKQIFRGEI